MSESDERWTQARQESDAVEWRLLWWYLLLMGVIVGLAVLVVWLLLR